MSHGALAGKTVVVTGAASGIGAAVAELARSQGGSVIGLDRNTSTGCDELDLSDEASIDAVISSLPPRFDVLCNVAGVPATQPDSLVLNVNLLGLRQLTLGLRARLAGGSVVNVASTAGSGWPSVLDEINEVLATTSMEEGAAWLADQTLEMDAYNFSKAALIVWTMRTAWEWRHDGPRLNCVSPGAVDTPILGDFHASMGPILGAVTALVGRDGRPEDIAPAVCFLASSESSWINGVNLIADGGFAGGMATGAVDVAALLGGGAP